MIQCLPKIIVSSISAAASRAQLNRGPDVCAPIDANGNLTSDGTKTYFWNALNQLVEAKEGTTTLATFEYDGKGRRAEKVAAGLTHQYVYDAEDIVEERISGSSSDTIRFFHGVGIDQPLARRNSGNVITYYLADHLGSIVQESSTAGAITLEREYDLWGVLLQGGSTSGFAFTGREWDSEIAMYYYRARYYAPSSGRFVSNDPIGFGGGTNFYGYVGNAPSQFVDPSGLCSSDPDQGAPPGGGSPNRRKEKDCLSQMFGGRSVDSVQIIEKGRGIGRDADTRRDEIRLYNGTTTDEFFDPFLAPFMLHEYFHVMEQWNTGRLSVWKYIRAVVGPGNKWEREADDFASAYTDWYLNCLKNP